MCLEAILFVGGSLLAFVTDTSTAEGPPKALLVAGSGAIGLFLTWQLWLWQRWAFYLWPLACLAGATIALWYGVDWPLPAGELVGLVLFGILAGPAFRALRTLPTTHRVRTSEKMGVLERRCRMCHSLVAVDADFCDACGTTVAPRCTECGTSNRPEARFCKKCGFPITEVLPGEAST